jgi:hypothetical protein
VSSWNFFCLCVQRERNERLGPLYDLPRPRCDAHSLEDFVCNRRATGSSLSFTDTMIHRLQRYCDVTVLPLLDSWMLTFSPVLVFVGFSLVFIMFYIAVTIFLPYKPPSSHAMHCSFAALMLINLVSRYLLAMLTDPGTIPLSTAYKMLEMTAEEEEPERRPGWTRCRHTGAFRPPRARYCQILKVNVLNYDHYCPWLFNAVGYQNLRHFVGFLLWVWFSTTYGALFAVDVFYETWGINLKENRMSIVFFTVTSILLSLFVGSLFAWHVYLAGTRQTSVDFLIFAKQREDDPDGFVNPYSHGTFLANLRASLLSRQGPGWLELVLPPLPHWTPAGEVY